MSEAEAAASEAFAERMLQVLNDAASALMVSIGHQTGLFDVMASLPPATSDRIASFSRSGRQRRPRRDEGLTRRTARGGDVAGDIDHPRPAPLNARTGRPDHVSMAEPAAQRTEVVAAADRGSRQRRRHPRVAVAGKVRLVADTPEGLVTLSGTLADLSLSGCAMRVYAPLEPGREARLELSIDGRQVWVSGTLVWTRTRDRAWVVGVRFEKLRPEKQSVLMRVIADRRRLLAI